MARDLMRRVSLANNFKSRLWLIMEKEGKICEEFRIFIDLYFFSQAFLSRGSTLVERKCLADGGREDEIPSRCNA